MKTVLCYGDSNTYGFYAATGFRYPRNVRWTGLLQQALGEDVYVIEEGLCGRTTVWEDPIEGYKSGKSYLIPCLDTHAPIDVIVLMLGTNDLKCRFSLTASDVAQGNATLIAMMQSHLAQKQGFAPKILLVSPIAIGEGIAQSQYAGMFCATTCIALSKQFPKYFAEVAAHMGCAFLDAASVAGASPTEHLHLDEAGHAALANAVAQKVRELL